MQIVVDCLADFAQRPAAPPGLRQFAEAATDMGQTDRRAEAEGHRVTGNQADIQRRVPGAVRQRTCFVADAKSLQAAVADAGDGAAAQPPRRATVGARDGVVLEKVGAMLPQDGVAFPVDDGELAVDHAHGGLAERGRVVVAGAQGPAKRVRQVRRAVLPQPMRGEGRRRCAIVPRRGRQAGADPLARRLQGGLAALGLGGQPGLRQQRNRAPVARLGGADAPPALDLVGRRSDQVDHAQHGIARWQHLAGLDQVGGNRVRGLEQRLHLLHRRRHQRDARGVQAQGLPPRTQLAHELPQEAGLSRRLGRIVLDCGGTRRCLRPYGLSAHGILRPIPPWRRWTAADPGCIELAHGKTPEV
ncbi:hypothetical protein [Cupriavidus sp. H18C1]|uniref:hypothetical protein n=1 Tax=Cupriavidus sp. H18C1 TaxID=3241601 RepID=UPI003BB986C6